VGHVDTTLCAGLDTLVTVVLALKDTTPAGGAEGLRPRCGDRGQHVQAGQLRELRPGSRGHEGRGDRREETEEIVEKKAEEMVKEAEEMVEKVENV
jgi:hypothetical protein